MWIINHFPWWSFGLEQCVCVEPKEAFEDNSNSIFPIRLDWVDNLLYIGRELLGTDFIMSKIIVTKKIILEVL